MEKRLANQIRRTNRARNFPINTCPASRHVHMMAEILAKGGKHFMIEEEPEHVAGSLLSVLESLWKLRTQTNWPNPKDKARQEKALTKLFEQNTAKGEP